MAKSDGYSSRGGFKGAHNKSSFKKAYKEKFGIDIDDPAVKGGVKVIKDSKHPGITHYEYWVPQLDKTGKILKPIKFKRDSFDKTVYDSRYTDKQMYQWGREAMRNGKKTKERDYYVIQGTSSNGIKFKGIERNGKVETIYPVIEFK